MIKPTLTNKEATIIIHALSAVIIADDIHKVQREPFKSAAVLLDRLDTLMRVAAEPDDLGIEDPRFTDEDKDEIFRMICEEASDMSAKEIAEGFMIDSLTYLEAVSYTSPIDDGETLDLLGELSPMGVCSISDYESGEHERHRILAAWARRLGLADDNGLTALGEDYIAENS